MLLQLNDIWANALYRRMIVTGLILLAWIVLRNLAQRIVIRTFPEDSPHIFRCIWNC